MEIFIGLIIVLLIVVIIGVKVLHRKKVQISGINKVDIGDLQKFL